MWLRENSMNYTFVQKTKILVYPGASADVGKLLDENGFRKAFLVLDPGIKKAGVANAEKLGLREGSYVEFNEIVPDPPAQNIDLGAERCRAAGCDCVIAVGGGSCIDTAKGINMLRNNPGKVLDYKVPGTAMNQSDGLISIPTTSGTGSELSNGMIITDTESGQKVPILAVNAMSEFAVLDPLLTVNSPKGLTISSGLDVFSHAFEGYTSNQSNLICDAICEKVMRLVVENLPVAVEQPANLKAREHMCVASALAGWMLANVSTHIGHSVAHVLGAEAHIAHGEACAYSLPGVIKLLSDVHSEKLRFVAKLLGTEIDQADTPEQIGEKTAQAYRHFRDVVLQMHPISDYSIPNDFVERYAEKILAEPFVANMVKPVTYHDVCELLAEIG